MRNPRFGTAPFAICHWDTFDNETLLVGGAKTLAKAVEKVEAKYGARLSSSGADYVQIVDKSGNVIRSWRTG